ncbi:synaptic vesicle membrane protein VAT-1 homolog [Schistocerca cancellata]|uniref:synaptic vesicle membrane protein VAT-1 homolog n=1 Tax=Schistocerca cancellata TaxID=274614 RepID=UPI002117A373|nr:synaptic vesicle membrane protein VAT-1 homolog [Schistocerca cancellata]
MDSFPLQYTAPTVIPATDTTRMVKSITLHGHGQFRRIKVEETPLEVNLASNHVEIEVRYCGLNFTDNYLRLGIIRNSNFPVIMGSECSGVITRLGEDIIDFEVGQKVLCLKMQGGLFRHVVQVPRKHCFEVPRDTDLKDAVAIGLNFLVAHVCLFEFGDLKPRHKIFMQSIAGGVGTAVIELAKTIPLVKIYGSASESKHRKLNALRIDRAFEHEEDYVEEILEGHPEGLDVVINSNGGTDVEKCFKMLNQRGMLINIGSNSTAIYPRTTIWGMRPTWDTKYVSSAELVSKNLSVAGLNIGRFMENYPRLTQDILNELFDLHSIGEIEPHVHSVLPFEKVAVGITQLCKRENYGKVILDLKKRDEDSDEPLQQVPEPEEAQLGNSCHEQPRRLSVALEEMTTVASVPEKKELK